MGDWPGGDGGSRFRWAFYGGLATNITTVEGLPSALFKIQHTAGRNIRLFALTGILKKQELQLVLKVKSFLYKPIVSGRTCLFSFHSSPLYRPCTVSLICVN